LTTGSSETGFTKNDSDSGNRPFIGKEKLKKTKQEAFAWSFLLNSGKNLG
jgi:hypothetical protein